MFFKIFSGELFSSVFRYHGIVTPATPEHLAKPLATERGDGCPPTITIAAGEVLTDAQRAMHDLLTGAGLADARASDVARGLGLDKTLAWKLAHYIGDAAPEAVRHMPGLNAIEIVFRAASRAGVASQRIDAARDADARLRAFMAEHAGDRRTFEAMLSGVAPDESLVLEERRTFFRAGSVLWGVRAQSQFLLLALRRSPEQPDKLDILQLSGFVALERLRPDLPWIIRRLRASDDSGAQMYQIPRIPLDPEGITTGGMPLIPDFCSSPLPEIRQTETASGWIYDELVPGPLGKSGAATIINGEVMPALVPAEHAEDNAFGRYMLTVRTPLEHVQVDLLIHEDLPHFDPPVCSVVGLLEDRATPQAHDGMHLQEPSPASILGTPAAVRSRRIPNYEHMATSALQRAGWPTPDAFRGYRFATDYPPAPCEINVRSAINPR